MSEPFFIINPHLGCRGVRGHFHRHREQRLLGQDVHPKEHSGEQVEVWHQDRNTWTPVCAHVWAGEGAERVDRSLEEGAGQAHVSSGNHRWEKRFKTIKMCLQRTVQSRSLVGGRMDHLEGCGCLLHLTKHIVDTDNKKTLLIVINYRFLINLVFFLLNQNQNQKLLIHAEHICFLQKIIIVQLNLTRDEFI